ncbi:cytochrome P450 [Thraustotheca clavata]|uniref:Cytochrome P450 n=1 Tax=Thraustotheca clavata TaxID=74557 RepID=A0A1W0A0I9_9STRA|nr:cytochrome P450 [Thraustotheca clavata]
MIEHVIVLVAICIYAMSRFFYSEWFMQKRVNALGLRALKGPPQRWLIGNLHQVAQNVHLLYDWKLQLTNSYGPTYCLGVDIFSNGSIFTSCPRNVEHILKTNHTNYIKPRMMEEVLTEFLGNSIFNINSNIPSWTFQRKLIASLTSASTLKAWTDEVFTPHLTDLNAILTANIDQVIDLEPLVLTWTTNCVCDMAFGSTMDKATMASLHELMKEAGELMFHRFTHPWYKWFKWCMPSEYRFNQVMHQINDITYNTINKHREAMKTTKYSSKHVLSELLRRQKVARHDVDISDNFIRDMMMTMFLAGRESVGSCVLWVIYCIAKHPDAEATLLTELQCLDTISYDTIMSLPYLDAVIQETLRLFPPAPINMKMAVKDDTLPGGTFVLAGTMVEYSPYVMGRDRTRWENADMFVPERWLQMAQEPNSYEFPVFNAGARSCVGKYVALAQTKIIIATIFKKFTFDLVPQEDDGMPIYGLGLTLFPRGGVHVIPHLRD